jgi:hypothetical protein
VRKQKPKIVIKRRMVTVVGGYKAQWTWYIVLGAGLLPIGAVTYLSLRDVMRHLRGLRVWA